MEEVMAAQEEVEDHTPAAPPAEKPGPKNLQELLGYYENEDEWEYEYSNTETETYYLTVDFSIPQFAHRRRPVRTATRGGHQYKNWTGPAFQRKPEMHHHRIHSDSDDTPMPEAEPDEEYEEEEEQGMTQEGMQGQRDGPQSQDQADSVRGESPFQATASEIQVLDLHSEHPLFSYRNRVFEGSWANVIGTELLFAEQSGPEDPRPLPSLRSLPGGIDLLAASSARIATTEKRLVPKRHANSGLGADVSADNEEDRFQDIKERNHISIPIWSDKTGERTAQARFLEDLMAIKAKKGEKDLVTVYAHAPPRERRLMGTGNRTRRAKSGGTKRRGSLEDQDTTKTRRTRTRGTLGGWAHASSLGLGRDTARGYESEREGESSQPAAPDLSLVDPALMNWEDPVQTVPTPERWSDLEDEDDDDDEDGDEDEDEGEDEDLDMPDRQ